MNTVTLKWGRVALIALILFAVFAWVYVKYIKPQIDAKREAHRVKLTTVVTSAQPADKPLTQVANPGAPNGEVVKQRVGIGGIKY